MSSCTLKCKACFCFTTAKFFNYQWLFGMAISSAVGVLGTTVLVSFSMLFFSHRPPYSPANALLVHPEGERCLKAQLLLMLTSEPLFRHGLEREMVSWIVLTMRTFPAYFWGFLVTYAKVLARKVFLELWFKKLKNTFPKLEDATKDC